MQRKQVTKEYDKGRIERKKNIEIAGDWRGSERESNGRNCNRFVAINFLQFKGVLRSLTQKKISKFIENNNEQGIRRDLL